MLYFLCRVDYPCPVNYNPADHYVHTLAIIPGNEEECKAKAMVFNFLKKHHLECGVFWELTKRFRA